jgi:hypothetical protein
MRRAFLRTLGQPLLMIRCEGKVLAVTYTGTSPINVWQGKLNLVVPFAWKACPIGAGAAAQKFTIERRAICHEPDRNARARHAVRQSPS